MPGKRTQNWSYAVHGEGISSLTPGFDEIGMPAHRRTAAVEIIREVLTANGASDFYWYKPPATEELCCYWDDATRNLMWINAGELHVISEPSIVALPARPVTYRKQDGDLVGWLLPAPKPERAAGPASQRCPPCSALTSSSRYLPPLSARTARSGTTCRNSGRRRQAWVRLRGQARTGSRAPIMAGRRRGVCGIPSDTTNAQVRALREALPGPDVVTLSSTRV